MIGLDDIDRWNVADIEAVFHVCVDQSNHCADQSANLKNLNTFETWDGDSAAAARRSLGRTRVDLDAHGALAERIGTAARAAAAKIQAIKAALAQVRADATAKKFAIDDDGTVRSILQTVMTVEDSQKREGQRIALQLRVNQILENAEAADDELAAAIEGADGEIPIDRIPITGFIPGLEEVYGLGTLGMPEYPPASLTDVEARNYYLEGERRLKLFNQSLANSDLSMEERARIGCELRNELRTQARELMSDRAAAEGLYRTDPNKTFDELIQDKMNRKGLTREQAIEDVVRSSSTSRGSVNAGLGVDPERPVLPDPEEIRARAGPSLSPADLGDAGAGLGRTALKIAGKAALPLAVGYEVYDGVDQVRAGTESVPEAVGSGTGAVAGMVAGAEYGAMAGAFGGPVGVAAGALIGGLAGGVIGGSVGKTIGGWFD
ncbi:phage head morphogenesis protein [Gordonia sp. ABSL1-1]|uniref:phage head morphogenesis protein n=1 Tax=Gordonia sp. ABSL1-1 TaxID=3053923 RepID=UPI0025726702|nr:phage head morphogenesis protein [Gordonia sp. ABSL1-1]MDL9936632.1 phage head morphogenesis protein [Gordonia sp. ABSL1-1]